MLNVNEGGDVVIFSVWVYPRASRDDIAGEWQGRLKVRLTAPPVGNRANHVLHRLLASIWKSRLRLLEFFLESAAGPNAWRCAERPLSEYVACSRPLRVPSVDAGLRRGLFHVWLSSSDPGFFPQLPRPCRDGLYSQENPDARHPSDSSRASRQQT